MNRSNIVAQKQIKPRQPHLHKAGVGGSASIFEKAFPNESCPECGGNLTVKTNCDPSKDDDFEIWFTDGDEVNCDDCDFKSCISVSEDGEAWVQD